MRSCANASKRCQKPSGWKLKLRRFEFWPKLLLHGQRQPQDKVRRNAVSERIVQHSLDGCREYSGGFFGSHPVPPVRSLTPAR
jgi:hypothetical protein